MTHALALAAAIHHYHLPTLHIRDRAQPLIDMPPKLAQEFCSDFLVPLFLESVNLLSAKYRHVPFDFDGRVFLLTLTFLADGGFATMKPSLSSEATSIIRNLEGFVDLHDFSEWCNLPEPSLPEHTARPLTLHPFNNPILNPHLPIPTYDNSNVSPTADRSGPRPFLQFGEGTMFSDTQHWHNQKTILPAHMGGKAEKPANPWIAMKRLRKTQNFMFNLQMQAATITGAAGSVLQQTAIPAVGRGAKSRVIMAPPVQEKVRQHFEHVIHLGLIPPQAAQKSHSSQTKKSAKPPKLSSKQLLLQKIQDQKLADANESSRTWWKEKMTRLETLPINSQVQELALLFRNSRSQEDALRLEMQLYRLHLEVQQWVSDEAPEHSDTKDKFTLSIMRLIKDMCDKKVLTPASKDAISTLLILFGFDSYTESLLNGVKVLEGATPTFKFKKLVKSKSGSALYPFMKITEDPIQWQLRLFGEYMDRSMDSAPDPRVPFEPDAWQRKVLDCIDANDSVLVVGELNV